MVSGASRWKSLQFIHKHAGAENHDRKNVEGGGQGSKVGEVSETLGETENVIKRRRI